MTDLLLDVVGIGLCLFGFMSMCLAPAILAILCDAGAFDKA